MNLDIILMQYRSKVLWFTGHSTWPIAYSARMPCFLPCFFHS